MDHLREQGVRDLVMAGPVRRPSLFSLMPDWRTAKFFARVGLRALGDDGCSAPWSPNSSPKASAWSASSSVLGGMLAPEGVWGRHAPDERARDDIAIGLKAARRLGRARFGQAVVVQQGAVLGVEGAEGTDALIRRIDGLRREGAPDRCW